VRSALEVGGPRSQLHPLEEFDDPCADGLRRQLGVVDPQWSLDVVADRVERVEGCERVLEHHLHLAPVVGRCAFRGRTAVQQHLAGRRRLELRDDPRDGRLARTALADERDGAVRFHSERHVGNGMQDR